MNMDKENWIACAPFESLLNMQSSDVRFSACVPCWLSQWSLRGRGRDTACGPVSRGPFLPVVANMLCL
ncbi:MAG: hypothetical protein R6U55_00240 [Desulfovermiculus sp.]